MGKSTVAAMFAARGVPVFDADAEVHRLQAAGGALVPAIEAAFPGATGANGVDRARLGHAVFGDDAALTRLEAIVHPAVATARADFLRSHANARVVLLDIPLLFEKAGWQAVDRIAV
ncbi:dephospho-CoA kinase, partial [Sphingomonas sp.]|uniref:dephospho-CoA kinase n=1 Tax=Sphingomonas sp. TaxID=28214 RepID=UPI002C7120C2